MAVLIFITLLFFLFTDKRGFLQHIRIQQERRELKQEITELEKIKTELEAEEKSLDDPDKIEEIAREEYGMSKKNETVYRVVPKEKE